MAQVRGVVPQLYDNVDKTVFSLFQKQLKDTPGYYKKLFTVETSDRKFERNFSYVQFGQMPLKPEGQDFPTQLVQAGYSKDLTAAEFGLGFEITLTAQEDDVYDVLNQYAPALARSARVAEESLAAGILNNGFTTEQSPDGVSIFNTAHALKLGGTARNRRDAALSSLNLQQAIIDLVTDQKSEEGFFTLAQDGLELHVPPALMMTAERVVSSPGLPGTNANDINPINKNYAITIVVNPYLSAAAGGSDTQWFLFYKGKRHGLVSYTRIPISAMPPERLPKSGNRFYAMRFRRSVGCARGWQGAYGSAGA